MPSMHLYYYTTKNPEVNIPIDTVSNLIFEKLKAHHEDTNVLNTNMVELLGSIDLDVVNVTDKLEIDTYTDSEIFKFSVYPKDKETTVEYNVAIVTDNVEDGLYVMGTYAFATEKVGNGIEKDLVIYLVNSEENK